jgi:hypothetical protein
MGGESKEVVGWEGSTLRSLHGFSTEKPCETPASRNQTRDVGICPDGEKGDRPIFDERALGTY